MEKALPLAGPDARLVTRPTGVPHVYTGPLTPSGRFAAAAGRTVCRARTRRLRVIPENERWSSLDPDARRLCARCSVRLSHLDPGAGGPDTTQLVARSDWRREYAALTEVDVAAALATAESVAEVDAAAHLSLLLWGVAGCARGFTAHGRTWPPLAQLVHAARSRVGAFNTDQARAQAAVDAERAQAAHEQAVTERRLVRSDREDRIRRLGYLNATRTRPP